MADAEELGTENTEQKQSTTEIVTDAKTEAKDGAESAEAPENAEESAEDLDANPGTEAGDEGEEAAPAKPVSRSQARIQKLSSELKAEREARDKLVHERAVAQAQLENIRRQHEDAQNAAQRHAEEERLSLLDPGQRQLYELDKKNKELEWRFNQLELRRRDDEDKARFHAKAATDEVYGKHADAVEQMYQEGISRGVSASREDLHSYLLGRELKKDLANKTSKKREIAGQRIASATAKAPSAKGDVAGTKKGKSAADRLEGVII